MTWGFDDPVLVRFGGIAMPFAVCETLDHFQALSPPSAEDDRNKRGFAQWERNEYIGFWDPKP